MVILFIILHSALTQAIYDSFNYANDVYKYFNSIKPNYLTSPIHFFSNGTQKISSTPKPIEYIPIWLRMSA